MLLAATTACLCLVDCKPDPLVDPASEVAPTGTSLAQTDSIAIEVETGGRCVALRVNEGVTGYEIQGGAIRAVVTDQGDELASLALDGKYLLPKEASDTLRVERNFHAGKKEALK